MNKKLHTLVNTVATILIVFLTFFLGLLVYSKIANHNVSSFLGYSIFEVATGSMSPTLKVGDWILIKKSSSYQVGDIITYQETDYYITHRIIEINDTNVITKGDANLVADNPISKDNIKGKYIMTLVGLPIVVSILSNPQTMISIILIFGSLLLYKHVKRGEHSDNQKN